MSRPLCAGRDPEWWTPASEYAAVARGICRQCTSTTCTDLDPEPHGVIHKGIAYGDTGKPLPDCPACDRPLADYRGGPVLPCGQCRVPDVPIPDRHEMRRLRVRWLVGQGASNEQIAADLGLTLPWAKRIRTQAGVPTRPNTNPQQKEAA